MCTGLDGNAAIHLPINFCWHGARCTSRANFFLFFFIPAIDFFKICAILYCMKDKTYNTYQARNAVKAAQVTNHIKAQKKVGVPHEEAKAEAYRLYNIKAARPILVRYWVAK